MDEKVRKVARTGSIMVRINNKFYEVPESCVFFKSHDNKDVYLSGIRNESTNSFKAIWIGTVKFVEDNKFEDVPMNLLEVNMRNEYKKMIIDDEEYDIPIHLFDPITRSLTKITKYDVRRLKEIKESCKSFLFKGN